MKVYGENRGIDSRFIVLFIPVACFSGTRSTPLTPYCIFELHFNIIRPNACKFLKMASNLQILREEMCMCVCSPGASHTTRFYCLVKDTKYKFHNLKFHILSFIGPDILRKRILITFYSSPNMIIMIKSRMMRWAGHVKRIA
jgi:hypothetical protein